MARYIGIDVHSSTCTFCVLDNDGVEISNPVIATNGKLLKGIKRLDADVRLKNRYSSIYRKNGQKKNGRNFYDDESLSFLM